MNVPVDEHPRRYAYSAEQLAPVRLVSGAGAAFALLPVPVLGASRRLTFDIELLTPDRLVRYLGRPFRDGSAALLGEFWMRAAEAAHPELSVASFADEESLLSIAAVRSTASAVTLEFSIVSDPASSVYELDRVAFDALRTHLIDASHSIQEWER